MSRTVQHASIANLIFVLRASRVMLDSDLARLYGVSTKRLTEQVKRNQDRFPEDFGFRLTAAEALALRSQIATSNRSSGDFATNSDASMPVTGVR